MTAKEFEYAHWRDAISDGDVFLLTVPEGLRSKQELLSALASAGCFPGHFGGNWDALEDCLRDLSWISKREVVILHGDIPLRGNPSECRIYLEILQTVLDDWARAVKSDAVEPPVDWAYVDHELRVVFPPEVEKDMGDIFCDAEN